MIFGTIPAYINPGRTASIPVRGATETSVSSAIRGRNGKGSMSSGGGVRPRRTTRRALGRRFREARAAQGGV